MDTICKYTEKLELYCFCQRPFGQCSNSWLYQQQNIHKMFLSMSLAYREEVYKNRIEVICPTLCKR